MRIRLASLFFGWVILTGTARAGIIFNEVLESMIEAQNDDARRATLVHGPSLWSRHFGRS